MARKSEKKEEQETVSADTGSVALPAERYIEVLGYRLPAYPYMLMGEIIELERLALRSLKGEQTGMGQNVEALAILIRHRLQVEVSADELSRKPVHDLAAFEAAMDALLTPFADGYRAPARIAALRARLERETARAKELTGE